MIHNVKRWQVRMKSGAVHVVDPITFAAAKGENSAFVGPITRALSGRYTEAYVFDRLEAVYAGDSVLIVHDAIETITERNVQIEAGEDAFS